MFKRGWTSLLVAIDRLRSTLFLTHLSVLLALLSGLATVEAEAGQYSVLHNFEGRVHDISVDANGNIYGTFHDGPCDRIFRLSRSTMDPSRWTVTVLHKFDDGHGPADGCYSSLPILRDNRIFGTTNFAFSNVAKDGSVYQLGLDGQNYKIVHLFNFTQGSYPTDILAAPDATLYGATVYGGSNKFCSHDAGMNAGVFYKLRPGGGGFRVLYEFDRDTGARPGLQLIFGPDGAVYGTAAKCNGGSLSPDGIVFRITTQGRYSIVYQFSGSRPWGKMAFGPDGVLYGTSLTSGGGDQNAGTVWALKPGPKDQPWSLSTLYTFRRTFGSPQSIVRDEDGSLYGATGFATGSAWGVLYRLSPPQTGTQWVLTRLHNFPPHTGDLVNTNSLNLYNGVVYGTTDGKAFAYTLK